MDVGSTNSQSALPRTRRRRRIPVIAALAAAGVFGGGAVVMAGEEGGAEACAATHVLRVAVAPELASVVDDAAAGVFPVEEESGDTCVHVDVVAADPADVARAITAQPPDRPDVWIPDASLWLDRLQEAGVALPSERPSVATSPAVLAISRDRAEASGWPEHQLSVTELLGDASTRLALRDPMTDAATATNLVGLMTAATELPEGRTVLAQVLRHAAQTPMTSREDVLAATTGTGAAAVSEQAVLANDRRTGSSPLVAVYPPSGGSLDYPFTVLTHNAADARSADRLLHALQGDDVKDALLSLGFRDGRGVGRPDTAGELGVDVTVPPAPVSSAQLAETLRITRVITSGTRMLAVIDVSGSMAQEVPGADGATRMEVTKEAAARGMSLYPDDAEIGLWVFSRQLTPDSDHQELVPIGPLGAREGGWLGRELLGRSLAGVQAVPDGATGLYDTVLAAVRTVRQNWDPTRVNSVVLLTDGRDEDEGGIGLPGLLSALQQESDPGTPVPVITIGLGSGSDTDALAAISQATGGSTYVAETGDDIYAVFEDAIGRRSCRPNC
jgi:Ca-activated chloride channel family protein